jgi:hypothetical protein
LSLQYVGTIALKVHSWAAIPESQNDDGGRVLGAMADSRTSFARFLRVVKGDPERQIAFDTIFGLSQQFWVNSLFHLIVETFRRKHFSPQSICS